MTAQGCKTNQATQAPMVIVRVEARSRFICETNEPNLTHFGA